MALESSLKLLREARKQREWGKEGIDGMYLPSRQRMFQNARQNTVQQRLFDVWSAKNEYSIDRKRFLSYIHYADANRNTRLHHFARENDRDSLFACLSEPDADVYLGGEIDELNAYGETALAIAVLEDNYECAVLLLVYKASPNRRLRGEHATALHRAAAFGSLDMVKLLLQYQANHHLVCLWGEHMLTAKQIAQQRIQQIIGADKLLPSELEEAQAIYDSLSFSTEDEVGYWKRQATRNLNLNHTIHYRSIVTLSDFRSGSTLFVDKLNGCRGDLVLELFGDFPVPTYQAFVERLEGGGKFLKLQRNEFYRHYPFVSYYLKHHHHDHSSLLIVILERKVVLEQYYSWKNLESARKEKSASLRNVNLAHGMTAEQKRDLSVPINLGDYQAYRKMTELYFSDLRELCYYNDLNCVHLYYEELESVANVAGHPLGCQSSVIG